eukprot:6388303-Prymnesium_polylepis.2
MEHLKQWGCTRALLHHDAISASGPIAVRREEDPGRGAIQLQPMIEAPERRAEADTNVAGV